MSFLSSFTPSNFSVGKQPYARVIRVAASLLWTPKLVERQTPKKRLDICEEVLKFGIFNYLNQLKILVNPRHPVAPRASPPIQRWR